MCPDVGHPQVRAGTLPAPTLSYGMWYMGQTISARLRSAAMLQYCSTTREQRRTAATTLQHMTAMQPDSCTPGQRNRIAERPQQSTSNALRYRSKANEGDLDDRTGNNGVNQNGYAGRRRGGG